MRKKNKRLCQLGVRFLLMTAATDLLIGDPVLLFYFSKSRSTRRNSTKVSIFGIWHYLCMYFTVKVGSILAFYIFYPHSLYIFIDTGNIYILLIYLLLTHKTVILATSVSGLYRSYRWVLCNGKKYGFYSQTLNFLVAVKKPYVPFSLKLEFEFSRKFISQFCLRFLLLNK